MNIKQLEKLIKIQQENDMGRSGPNIPNFYEDHLADSQQQLIQMAEQYASSLHARLDEYGQTSEKWRQAYRDALKRTIPKHSPLHELKDRELEYRQQIYVGPVTGSSIPVQDNTPKQLTPTSTTKEVFAVSAPFSDKVLKLFTTEADAIAYAKGLGTAGLSDGTVTKLELFNSLDSLTEVEKVELKYRSGK